MKKYAGFLLIGVWFALNALPAWAQTTYTYHRDIGASIIFAWDHDKACPQTPSPSTFDGFEFRGIKVGSTTDVRLQGKTSDTQVPIAAAFEGQLFYQVREVCLRAGVPIYSEYANSNNAAQALVDGAARAWVVSYDLKPPTDVTISKP